MEFMKSIDIKVFFFIVPAVLFIHELEEWNIYDFHKRSFNQKGIVETKLGIRLWLVFLSIVGFIWTLLAYFIPDMIVSSIFFMLLVDFTLLNGIQHVGITLKTKKYYPGFIFGGLIGLFVNCIIIWRLIVEEILPWWLTALLICLIIPGLIDTIISGRKNRQPKMLEKILLFSNKLEKLFTE